MLSEISIHDFAIIDSLSLRLGNGLNVLTGETGAGKSIVIDALSFVLGARGGPSLVRAGARLARVEAVFTDVSDDMAALLDEWNVVADERTVVLARETTSSGRNTYRVNGHMVTQPMLKAAGDLLIETHGQHDTFGLLSPSLHLDMLDRLGGAPLLEARASLQILWKQWKTLRDERHALVADARERERRREWLAFEADEIAALALRPDELETLEAERSVLANADRIRSRAEEAVMLLDGGDDGGVRSALGRVVRLLAQIEPLDPASSAVAAAAVAVGVATDELRRDLGHYADSVEADPRRLDQVNERLSAIHRLQKKYGTTIREIVEYEQRAREELAGLELSEGRAHELESAIGAAAQMLAQAAGALSAQRREVAASLEGEVARELAELEMPNTRFAVRFEHEPDAEGIRLDESDPLHVSASGIDRVEFLISANPGQPLQPLARIASGGEMSRVMLAMQSVLARVNPVPTMIFDEVDAGLGGVAAEAVAARLRKIAESTSGRQVVCVTHLPLVAAAASVHWSLSKHVHDGRTTSRARILGERERAEEIARMMAGKQASDTTLRQAEEMLGHRKPRAMAAPELTSAAVRRRASRSERV